MIWTLNIVLLVVMTWPASAADNPCGHVQKDPEFTACWHEQFKKSEAEVAQRLRVLAALIAISARLANDLKSPTNCWSDRAASITV